MCFTERLNLRPFLAAIFCAWIAMFSDVALLSAATYIIASAALMPPLYTLASVITFLRAAGICRAAFRYGERLLGHKAVFDELKELRLTLFDRVAAMPPLNAIERAEYLRHAANTISTTQDFYLRAVVPALAMLMTILAGTAILCHSYGNIALLLPLVFIIRVAGAFFKRSNTSYDAKYRAALIDATLGMDELKAAGSEHVFGERLDKLAARKGDDDMNKSNNDTTVDFVLTVISATSLAIFLRYTANDSTAFAVTSVMTLAILNATAPVTHAVRAAITAFVCDNLKTIPLTNQRINTAAQQGRADNAIVAVQNLSYSLPNERRIFDVINFTVKKGEGLTIRGESGSGKTTLAYLLLKLREDYTGKIFLDNQDYADLTPTEVRQKISASVDGEYLFSGTVRELFSLLTPQTTDKEIIALLKAMDLPLAANYFLTKDAANLSGGERVRLKTALALARKTNMVLLDEPLAHLDKKTADQTAALIANMTDTLIVITHDADAFVGNETTVCLR